MKSFGKKIPVEYFIQQIVTKCKPDIREPDDEIIKQGDKDDFKLYLLAQGECHIWIEDHKRNKYLKKILRGTEFFGEISLVYGCARTATVVSHKYSTLACLDKQAYQELCLEFNDLKAMFLKEAFSYRDRQKEFITKSVSRVQYLQDISEPAIHDIIYSMDEKTYLAGEIFQQPGDDATTLYFLQDGMIEIYTKTDSGEDFILEKLFPGSVVNFRTFFLESNAEVYFRFGRKSYCRELTFSNFESLLPKYPELRQNFQSFKMKTQMLNMSIPLDYIMIVPRYLREVDKTKSAADFDEA